MKYLNQSQIDKLIQTYADGRISRENMQLLEKWVQESDANLEYFIEYRNLMDNSSSVNINTGQALEKVLDRIGTKKPAPRLLPVLLRVAAFLVIPLLIATIYLWSSKTADEQSRDKNPLTLFAAFGSVSSFSLDDGSKVWLNAGSSLQFPGKFSGCERVVYLTGEAYFEVKSNAKSPFIVRADKFSVKATGTRFSVMSYADQAPSVTLAEGAVTLFINAEGQGPKSVRVSQDQHVAVDRLTSEITTEVGDTYKHFAWKDGKLIFRNDLMADVMHRISLQYNADIEIADDILLQNRYRATFENESLTDVLDLLKLASPFQYRQINSVNLPDGRFTRKKIIITKSSPAKLTRIQ